MYAFSIRRLVTLLLGVLVGLGVPQSSAGTALSRVDLISANFVAPTTYGYDALPQRSPASTLPQRPVAGAGGAAQGHVGSWSAPATGVAAEDGSAVAGRTLTTPEQRAVRSLQRQVDDHTTKLNAYKADPDAYDNQGLLARAPSPEIRQRIIDGRVRHLQTEISGFQDQIDKLVGGN